MNPAPSPSPTEPVEWACMRLKRDLSEVGPATDALTRWLKARGVPAGPALDDVSLAVTEALTNAIRHGGGGAEDFTARLAWSWRAGELEVEVSEPGKYEPGPDWDRLPEDPLAESGRGGFLVTELMDAVEHRNGGGRHALRLRRRLEWRADATIEATESALGAMTEDLVTAYETISTLFGLAEDLATAAELEAMARKSLARLGPLLGADGAWVRVATADGKLRRLASNGPALGPEELDLESGAIEPVVAKVGVERTLESRAALPADDPLHAPGGCAFVCPFSFEGRLRGVLTIKRGVASKVFFSASQIALARTLADFLGIACANAELQTQRRAREQAQRELEIAAQIQRALLPRSISRHAAWAVAGVCAQAAEVGGDFFDVIDLEDGARLVVIADVMGKGVPAALMAATLRTALRSLATTSEGPGQLLTRANRQLCADLGSIDMFITAQVVWLDARGGRARFANAGHCWPLVLGPGPDGRPCWWDQIGGLPVGVSAQESYEESEHAVPEGATAWLMTDGALETENQQGEQLGAEGFARLARGITDPTALLAALSARASSQAPNDDCTIICFSRLPSTA